MVSIYTKDKFTGSSRLRSVVKIIGGKTKLRDKIYSLMPESYDKYIEPFIGSATVLIGKEKTKNEVVGDIFPYTINFFKCIQQDPNWFFHCISQDLLELQEGGKEQFISLRDSIKASIKIPDFEQASYYYLINKSCTNGIVRFNLKGKCNSSYCGTTHGRGWITKEWMDAVYERIKDVKFIQADYSKLLDMGTKDSFAYIDAPYYKVWTSYGAGRFTVEDHLELKEQLDNFPGRWLQSINDHPEIRELYKDYNILEVQTPWSCSNTVNGRGIKTELIIKNY